MLFGFILMVVSLFTAIWFTTLIVLKAYYKEPIHAMNILWMALEWTIFIVLSKAYY